MNNQAKPGCFSSPLCFDRTRSPCTACNWQSQCGPASVQVASQLRTKYGIDQIVRHRRGKAETEGPIKVQTEIRPIKPIVVSGNVSKSAADIIEAIQKQGIDLAGAVQQGRNPFLTRPPAFMRVLVQRLLEGDFSRAEARALLISKFGLEANVDGHLDTCIEVMTAMGVIDVKDDIITRREA